MLASDIYNALSQQFENCKINDSYIEIQAVDLLACVTYLKDEAGFDYLEMVTASDHNESFLMVYSLINTTEKVSVMLKTYISRENPIIESLSNLYTGANYQEREVYDLMGINFLNHPNLKRIVLWDGFEGHPQRKDFKDVA